MPPIQATPGFPGFVPCVPGHYYNFDAFGEYADFTHEAFPAAPAWQGSVDAQYNWTLHNDYKMFAGVNVNFVSSTTSFFVNRNPTPAYYAGPTPIPPLYNGTGFVYLNCAGGASATRKPSRA